MKINTVAVLLKYYNGELNPFDQAALECALLTGAEVTVIAMAPLSVKPLLESVTRLGAKAILVSDTLYAGSDTLATSLVLSKAVEKLNPDAIFCGRQSIDGDTAQVPPMLAKRLGYDIVSKVIEFDGQSYKTRLGAQGDLSAKTVYTFERIKTLRFPSMFSKTKEVDLLTNKDLMLNSQEVGLLGSPTQVKKTYQSQVGRRFCKLRGFCVYR
jgi:electron transfer flavoprotein beta subunit